jgi:histone deacetylase complex regulatory component SIN3
VNHLFAAAPDLLEDFKMFLPEPAAQAHLRTQQDLLEIERYKKVRYKKVEPQAPVDDGRRKRARYDLTDDEDGDEASTHRTARVATWILDVDPYDANDGNVLNAL